MGGSEERSKRHARQVGKPGTGAGWASRDRRRFNGRDPVSPSVHSDDDASSVPLHIRLRDLQASAHHSTAPDRDSNAAADHRRQRYSVNFRGKCLVYQEYQENFTADHC